jgi:hypothetical protein
MKRDGRHPTEVFPFIVARGRSGTTLLRAMLNSHPVLAIPGESHFPLQFLRREASFSGADGFRVEAYLKGLFAHWAFRRWDLDPDAVRARFRETEPHDLPQAIRLTFACNSESEGKERYGDKTPSFLLALDELGRAFPEARFVHLIRDGRDVALSYLSTDFGVRSVEEAAVYWDRFVRAGRDSGRRLGPERYLEVRYEELVEEPDAVARRVCSFVGLPFVAEMLRYFERVDPLHRQLSHREHHRNLYLPPTKGLRNWRQEMDVRDIELFEALAGDLLTALGYERATPRISVSARMGAARARASILARRARGHLSGAISRTAVVEPEDAEGVPR